MLQEAQNCILSRAQQKGIRAWGWQCPHSKARAVLLLAIPSVHITYLNTASLLVPISCQLTGCLWLAWCSPCPDYWLGLSALLVVVLV